MSTVCACPSCLSCLCACATVGPGSSTIAQQCVPPHSRLSHCSASDRLTPIGSFLVCIMRTLVPSRLPPVDASLSILSLSLSLSLLSLSLSLSLSVCLVSLSAVPHFTRTTAQIVSFPSFSPLFQQLSTSAAHPAARAHHGRAALPAQQTHQLGHSAREGMVIRLSLPSRRRHSNDCPDDPRVKSSRLFAPFNVM